MYSLLINVLLAVMIQCVCVIIFFKLKREFAFCNSFFAVGYLRRIFSHALYFKKNPRDAVMSKQRAVTPATQFHVMFSLLLFFYTWDMISDVFQNILQQGAFIGCLRKYDERRMHFFEKDKILFFKKFHENSN